MSQDKVYSGVFQETNVTKDIYTRELSGYRVVVSKATSAHSGGVAMLFCEADHFSVEALRLHGARVFRFQLTSSGKRWYIVG